jgi:hypothetical protein
VGIVITEVAEEPGGKDQKERYNGKRQGNPKHGDCEEEVEERGCGKGDNQEDPEPHIVIHPADPAIGLPDRPEGKRFAYPPGPGKAYQADDGILQRVEDNKELKQGKKEDEDAARGSGKISRGDKQELGTGQDDRYNSPHERDRAALQPVKQEAGQPAERRRGRVPLKEPDTIAGKDQSAEESGRDEDPGLMPRDERPVDYRAVIHPAGREERDQEERGSCKEDEDGKKGRPADQGVPCERSGFGHVPVDIHGTSMVCRSMDISHLPERPARKVIWEHTLTYWA